MGPDQKKEAGKGLIVAISDSLMGHKGEPNDYEMAKEDAAKDVLAAIEAKDVSKLSAALKDFMDLCETTEEETPEKE
jgi:hypothetical protein